MSQFVIDIYFCCWVLLLLLYPLWFRVRVTDPLSRVTHWSCYHEIFFKTFISTFASTIATNFIKMWLKSSWIQPLSQVSQKYASPVSQHQWKLNLKGLWFRVKSLNHETFHYCFLLLTIPRKASNQIFSNKLYWDETLSLLLKWWNAIHWKTRWEKIYYLHNDNIIISFCKMAYFEEKCCWIILA